MDEKLKQKLELLGEPTLPDSLSAKALFRRMDSGELVLPDEEAPVSTQKVIPWAKVLRRGVPIAACLALVVLLSQGGLWRMGSSGANLAGGAAQKSAVADLSAPADGGDPAPAEQYSREAANDDDAPEPDPGPRAITMDGVEEETDEDAATGTAEDTAAEAAADGDTARAENAENGGEKSAGTADSVEADEPEVGRPDIGGDFFPDMWVGKIGEDDADTVKSIWGAFNEVLPELTQQDETLAGMIPFNGLAKLQYDTYDDVTAYFPFGYKMYEIVTYRAIRCSIARGEDGEFHIVELFSYEEREPD